MTTFKKDFPDRNKIFFFLIINFLYFCNQIEFKTMTTFIDTLDEAVATEEQDNLTPKERAYWEASIERDMRDIAEGKPKKHITLEQFGQELMAAVRSKI